MIFEVAILPDSFEKQNDTTALITTLKTIVNNGVFIADFKTGLWSKKILEKYITEYENSSRRDKLITLLKHLKDRKKIVKLTNYNHVIESLADWIVVSKKHFENESLDLVVSGENSKDECKSQLSGKYHSLNELLLSDEWEKVNKSDIVIKKTPSDFNCLLKKMLTYVRTIKLIDPYLLPKSKYKSTIELCVKHLNNKNDFPQQRGEIEIHTKIEEGVSISANQSRWKEMLKDIENSAHHTFKVFFWKDNSLEDKFHDRFILTNIFGVSSSHSLDIHSSSSQEITLSLLSRATYEKHLNNFSQNDQKFQLICDPLVITSV